MSKVELSLEGKVAIITGSRRGIGRAYALTFAEAGADVVVSDVVADGELETVAREIEKLGRRSLALRADATKKADTENLAEKVIEKFGQIDVLVNNAGVGGFGKFMELSEEEWDRVMDINLKSAFLCSQAVGKRMVERKQGSIVNIASTAALHGVVGAGSYPVAKAGVVVLTRSLALELAPYHIRVNALAPGWTQTKFNEALWSNPDVFEGITASIPMKRWAELSENARAALFLASDVSSYMTGQVLVSDGGVMA
ncbi:MAG: 3-oxoacyl-ACP reductase family protein [Chloroflexota bacterium]